MRRFAIPVPDQKVKPFYARQVQKIIGAEEAGSEESKKQKHGGQEQGDGNRNADAGNGKETRGE